MKFKASMLTLGAAVSLGGLVAATTPMRARAACAGQSTASCAGKTGACAGKAGACAGKAGACAGKAGACAGKCKAN